MSSIGIPELDSSETKLCRSSLGVQDIAVHPSRGDDAPEGSAYVCGIKRSAGCRREHEVELLTLASAFARRDLLVFVSPCARTDLQRWMVGVPRAAAEESGPGEVPG